MSPSPESAAQRFAHALLGELVRRGIRDLVLCPGSRSQALALAAATFEAAGALRLRVRLDERTAGFLALGLARETGRAVPVVTTSGTAVANLHPAVLEAAHSGIPLVVISADRPASLRGTGANQTTVQPGIFADAAVASADVAAPDTAEAALALAAELADTVIAGCGPVHLNVQFVPPLSDAVLRSVPEFPSAQPADAAPADAVPLDIAPDASTIVLAGADAGERAEELARELGAPLVAEPSSGARFGPQLVVAARTLLADPDFGGRVRRAVVLGHPTLTREVPALLAREDVRVLVLRGHGRDPYAPPGSGARIVDAVRVVGTSADRGWAGRWVRASRALLEQHEPSRANLGTDLADRARFARRELARMRRPVERRDLVEAVWAATWPHDRLVVGASRLIRELDRYAPGKRIRVHANRGLAGIDGTVSTGVGVALGLGGAGVTRVLLGDLTLLHDVGGMLFPDGEERPNVQLVVGNDGGGTIFDGLEVAGTAGRAAFERVMLTPQHADLRALAAAYGWDYRCVATRGELDGALTASGVPTLVEVLLER